MVSAHTDLHQLVRLCKKLKDYGDVFVHVDKKTGETFFVKLQNYITEQNSNAHYKVVLLNKRVPVRWGAYSQLDALELLLEYTLSNNKNRNYDRIFFISGLCYPLFSKKKLQEWCEEFKGKECITAFNITKGKDLKQLQKINLYHYFRDINLPHKSCIRRIIIGFAKIFLKNIGIRKKPYLVINGEKWDVYFSSQWFAITNDCACYVLNVLKNNKELKRYFKTTYAPDELVVATIVMNSGFGKNAYEIDSPNFEKLAMLHYLHYTTHILVYDEKDFERMMQSNRPFVRKVVSEKSGGLLKMIDEVTSFGRI